MAEYATLHGRPISSSSTSKTCLRVMQTWIDECRESHTACLIGNSMCLPTYVIDVGHPDGIQHLYLLLSKGRYGRDAALSHCWGPPSTTDPNLKTEEDST